MKKSKIFIVLIIGIMIAVSMVIAACRFGCEGDGMCHNDPEINTYRHCGFEAPHDHCRVIYSAYTRCDC